MTKFQASLVKIAVGIATVALGVYVLPEQKIELVGLGMTAVGWGFKRLGKDPMAKRIASAVREP